MEEVGLSTEWCGIFNSKFVEPKSFSNLDDESKAKAYHALAYLLGNPYQSKDIKRVGPAQIGAANGFFFDLLLADSIIKISDLLRTIYRPHYKSKTELRSSVHGKINFAKTLEAKHGLLHQHVCEFPVLTFDHEVFGFLKRAIPSLTSRLERITSPELGSRLKEASNLISELTRETNLVRDPMVTALKIVLSRISLKPEMMLLNEHLPTIAYFFLGQTIGISNSDALKETKGIILNLNRPFERILLKSMIATGLFSHDRSAINELYFEDTGGNRSPIDPMIPDCKGVLKIPGNEFYLLLDAKHKIFADGTFENGDSGFINRADLYQVTSYGLTSKHKQNMNQIVGLVGLATESKVESSFLTRLPDVVIDFNGESFSIRRFAFNFASALISISTELDKNGDVETVFKRIGNEIIEVMGVGFKSARAS